MTPWQRVDCHRQLLAMMMRWVNKGVKVGGKSRGCWPSVFKWNEQEGLGIWDQRDASYIQTILIHISSFMNRETVKKWEIEMSLPIKKGTEEMAWSCTQWLSMPGQYQGNARAMPEKALLRQGHFPLIFITKINCSTECIFPLFWLPGKFEQSC